MPKLEDHLALGCLLDGVAQVKLTNISTNFQSGAQDVETFQGFSGKTPGSRKLEVTANWAVALNGLEFSFIKAIALGTYHDLQIPVGADSVISRGYFRDGGLSRSVNSATEATATFVGTFDPPE